MENLETAFLHFLVMLEIRKLKEELYCNCKKTTHNTLGINRRKITENSYDDI
jgi:hypothetical protein